MEFLAESIGLLDLDSSSRPYVASAPDNTSTPTNTSRSTNSILFGWWGATEARASAQDEHAETVPANDSAAAAIKSKERISNTNGIDTSMHQQQTASQKLNNSYEEDELEQYLFHEADNCESSSSLLSSLSPDSPLTLSASSLNLKNSYNELSDVIDASNNNNSHQPQQQSSKETIITKTTTHRLTPQGSSFSGNIDAITGHLIHGTLISNQLGTVYEGSFACNGLGESVRHGNGECVYPDFTDYSIVHISCGSRNSKNQNDCGRQEEEPDGNNRNNRLSGSIKFVGRYEWDVPKAGVWFGNGWVYEGELSSVREIVEEQQQQQQHAPPLLSTDAAATVGRQQQHQQRKGVIGVSNPLPDNVMFHGIGRFMTGDGYIYQGEFMSGLACGVGKEILPHNKGVYYGEFWNGLRHGVGTLMEYTFDEEEDDATANNDDDLDCPPCAFDGIQEDEGEQHVQDGSLHSINLNDDVDNRSNNGPDFAAGVLYNSLPTTIYNHNEAPISQSDNNASTVNVTSAVQSQQSASSASSTNQQNTANHPTNTKNSRILKQRYSSGVWIAGQYEIEDSRCFMKNNKREEEAVVVDNGEVISRAENEKAACSPSLNRTTWDLLDEKWLGLE